MTSSIIMFRENLILAMMRGKIWLGMRILGMKLEIE